MDSMIPNRQKNTLAEYMIVSGADNVQPSWTKTCMILGKVEWNYTCKTENMEELYLNQLNMVHSFGLRLKKIRVAKDLWEKVQLLMQVNTKFLNSLPPEWSKFVTDVKLVKDLHTTNFDQLHAYLE
ncbi:hypothetical protein Tco_0951180 [Tanacetum coccineum]|uniref:Uncharacterized protein n=1 Tax=Tanacetum coccineum TaxID=301880 RepID=A0ABQ5DTD9_9ASTR